MLEAIYRKQGLPLNGYPKSNQQIEGASKVANQVAQEADEATLEKKDSVHASDEKYKVDEVLRFGLVVARSEERHEMEQVI